MALIHFLLVFDLAQQRLLEREEFDDAEVAGTAYARTEHKYRGRSDVEVVLVGADSIETIERTHSHYFKPRTTASPYLPA